MPTRVASYEGAGGYGTNTTPKADTISALAGDLLTFFGSAENGGAVIGAPPNLGGAITWTAQGSVNAGNSARSVVYAHTGIVQSDITAQSLSVARTGSAISWDWTVTVWRNHGGVGNVFTPVQAGSIAQITGLCSAGSALTGQANDWNAVDGGSPRNWLFINGTQIAETTYYSNPGNTHTVYGGRVEDVGPAGSKTWGVGSPSGQLAAVMAIEVLAAPVLTPSRPILLESGLFLTTEAGVPLMTEGI